MPAVYRVGTICGAVAALALVMAGCGSAAGQLAAPSGARLTFFEFETVANTGSAKDAEGEVRLVSADPEGGDRQPLANESSLDATPIELSWSADGSEFAFLRGHSAYVADADGSDARAVAGTAGTGKAVLSPDGTQLAFTRKRGQSTDTWIVPVAGGKPRQLTSSARYRTSVPSSFSPDGKTLLVTFQQAHGPLRLEAIDVASGKVATLATEAADGAYSPDGSRIAFISYRDHQSVPDIDGPVATGEVYVADADGRHLHRLTHSAKKEESGPTWDPSGNRLAFLRFRGGTLGFLFSEVVESNVDGSCADVVARLEPHHQGGEGMITAPAWWPGPGRGVGPISC